MSPDIKVFNKPHKRRMREAEFLKALVHGLGGKHIPHNFPIEASFLALPVDSYELTSWLSREKLLPLPRKRRCIEHLADLPQQLFVALEPSRISFDFVVQFEEDLFFIEFHEKQHRTLSVDKLKPVYDVSGREYHVPRFLQRLIRDVWRVKHFPNYTIVWHDWFERHKSIPELVRGFNEYHIPNMFSFRAFMSA